MNEAFNIGPWRVEPQRLQLCNAGTTATVKPKSMAVLLVLAAAEGQVVTRRELMNQVWGDAEVTDDVLTQCIVELRRVLGDNARHPRYIETIKRVGFRLIPTAETATRSQQVTASRPTWPLLMVLGLLLAGIAWYFAEPQPTVEPLSLAVLPFVSYGDDDGHFADGVAEELLDALARIPKLNVLARTSSFALAEQNLTIPQIGRILHVAYVVDGSVRRDGERIRVSAQLIETDDGYQRWSRSYAHDLNDVFEVQEQIASDITEALAVNLGAVADRATTRNANAFDLYLAGKHHARLGNIGEAVALFEKAVAADPGYALAHAELAKTLVFFQENRGGVRQSGDNFSAQLQRAHAAADAAIRLAPQNVDAHIAQAAIAMVERDVSQARRALEHAIDMDPKSVEANMRLAELEENAGAYARAIAHLEIAAESDPLNPELAVDHARLIALFAGYEAAVAHLTRLIDLGLQSPRLWDALQDLAADFGRYVDRVRFALQLERAAPEAAWPKAQLGDAFTELGAFELADAWIAAAERISPGEAFKSRARWYAASGNLDAFLQISDEALRKVDESSVQMSPAQSAATGLRAIAALNSAQPEQAVALIRRIIADSPTLRRRKPQQIIYADILLAQALQDLGDATALQQVIDRAEARLDTTRNAGITRYPWLTLSSAALHELAGNSETASREFDAAVAQGWRAWYLEQHAAARSLSDRADTIERIEADLARMREVVQREGLGLPPSAYAGVELP